MARYKAGAWTDNKVNRQTYSSLQIKKQNVPYL